MSEQRIYRPEWYQKEFHRSNARYRILLGGRQSGKTLAGIMESLKQAQEKPGSVGLIIAPTYNMLWDNIIKDMLSWIPRKSIKEWNQTRLDLKLINGTEIRFRSGDNPDRFRGTRPDWLWLDEVRDMKSYAWDVIQPGMAVTNGIAWFTTTPNGHDWVYKTFVEPFIRGEKDFWWTQFKTSDNPYADKERIELARQSMTDRMFRQEYEASIEDFVGLVYPDFKHSVHIVDNIEVQNDWLYFEGIDVGKTNPSAVLLAAADNNNSIYILDEIYESGLDPDQLVPKIKELEGRYNLREQDIAFRSIDPASRQVPQAAKDSVFTQLNEALSNLVGEDNRGFSAAPNHDVIDGIARVSQFLRIDDRGRTNIYISNKCQKLIGELEEYIWDPSNVEEKNSKEAPRKYKDHAVDALRYMIMMRPALFEYPVQDPWSGKTYYDGEDPDEEYLKGSQSDTESQWEEIL